MLHIKNNYFYNFVSLFHWLKSGIIKTEIYHGFFHSVGLFQPTVDTRKKKLSMCVLHNYTLRWQALQTIALLSGRRT